MTRLLKQTMKEVKSEIRKNVGEEVLIEDTLICLDERILSNSMLLGPLPILALQRLPELTKRYLRSPGKKKARSKAIYL